ncbi:MAG TPA: right-handed parallel beta-helix repeat-containing protein [Rhizomicrobium sp.]|jgi:hypothetical protein
MQKATLTALAVTILGITSWQTTSAAVLCVDRGNTACYKRIAQAVAAAAPGDTITVASGTYREDVVIGKPLQLIGENSATTVINARGKANGLNVDGLDNPGLANVTISGFTVARANFEGILVTNASNVTVQNNQVIHNNQSLDTQNAACPGLPAFETSEAEDCGEGLHLIGTDHSSVAGNLVANNAGGILISDETAANHDNVISNNVVRDNIWDCGITIPSHPPAPGLGSTPFGIYKILVTENTSLRNGTSAPGAGIGLFAFLPGARVSDNVIVGNQMIGNGMPGLAIHAHSPSEDFSNNVIEDNFIANNGPDTADAATPGPTGINAFGVSAIDGLLIYHNTVKREGIDVVTNTPATVEAHENSLLGGNTGLDNLGSGSVNAQDNWWGCSKGPNSKRCSAVAGSNVVYDPWLSSPPPAKLKK